MASTSIDVARLAGVSQPTVSRALRGDRRITPATISRVRQAAVQLGYVPSHVARSLATRSTKRVAVVAAELTNPFYPELIAPLHDKLEAAGFGTILVTDRGDKEMEYAPLFDGSIDGVVLTACDVGSNLPGRLAARGIPLVLVNRSAGAGTEAGRPDEVVPDNAAGATAVANLLADNGHRRIGCIAGPNSISTGLDRETAFRDALAERGIPLRPSATIRGPFDHRTGHQGLAALMELPKPPTAIFCGNDVIAIGALNAAANLHLEVPGQVSVVGFDDIPAAAWELIRLTTVAVDLQSMADQAIDLLIARIADPHRPPQRCTTPTTLILRETHTVSGRVDSGDRRSPR